MDDFYGNTYFKVLFDRCQNAKHYPRRSRITHYPTNIKSPVKAA